MPIFIVLLLILVIIWRNRSSWDGLSKNSVFVYMCVWLGSLLISCFGLYNFPVPGTNTYLMQLLHVFCFFIGAKMCKCRVDNLNFENDLENEFINITQSKSYKTVCIVFFIYMATLLAIFYQQMIIMMSFHDLRSAYYEGGLYGSLYDLIKGPILEPTYYVLTFTFSFSLLRKRSLWAVIPFVAVIIYISLSGGRFGYVLFLVAVVFTYFVFSNLFVNKKRVYLSFACMGALTLLAIAFVTNGRTGSVNGGHIDTETYDVLEEHIVSYTSAPNVAFEYQVEHNVVDQIGGYKYGALTFSSIENMIFSFVYKLGIRYKRPIALLTDITQNERIALGDFNWNALYTSSLYYYCDLGILGLVLFPLLFGYCFRKSIYNIYKYRSVASLVLSGVIFMKMIFSVCMFGATDMFFAIFLLALYLLRKKRTISVSDR